MILGLTDIVNIIAMFQLLIFAFFLIRKKSNRQSNKILAAFLLIQLLIIYDYESFHLKNYIISLSPHILFSGSSFIYLAAPSFYLYVKSLTFADFKIKSRHFLHAVPFCIASLIFVFFYHLQIAFFNSHNSGSVNFFPPNFWIIYNAILMVQILLYFITDMKMLKNYSREIKEQYSSVKNINLSWLNYIIYAFILAWISSVIVFLSRNYFWFWLNELVFLNFFAFFVFFNYIFYKGLTHPEIFSGMETKTKYTSSKLTSSDAEAYLTKLSGYMDKEKPYLNPTLTLKELSIELSIPARYLSQIINEHLQTNFYDYISKYRIEEAKSILSDETNDKTVLEILYQVGFNSKSSFNTAFKKFTGTTPSKFKKDYQNAL